MNQLDSHDFAAVRIAGTVDADAIGRLLHDFNAEFGEHTPTPGEVADRMYVYERNI